MLSIQSPWILIFSSIGFLLILKNSISFFKWIYITFLRPPKNLKKYGSWALITGSTDGIGKAFALQFAKEGLNLILVSRSTHKLKQVSNEIQEKYQSTKIIIVAIDFTGEIVNGLHEMEEAIKGLDIGVLINNVGITYPCASYFHEVDENVWMNLMKVNIIGTTFVTKIVLQGMIERRRGAIVNIGSGASIVVPSHPLYAIYAASKAYVDQLSRCLNVEYSSWGIDVQCQVPLYVSTKMASKVASIKKSSLFVPSAENYVKSAIRQIGYEHRCTPYWTHSLQWFFASMLPESLLDYMRLSTGFRRMKST